VEGANVLEGEKVLVGDKVSVSIGDVVGVFVGAIVGDLVGDRVGDLVGALVGAIVGELVGVAVMVGAVVGMFIGALVTETVGGGGTITVPFFFFFLSVFWIVEGLPILFLVGLWKMLFLLLSPTSPFDFFNRRSTVSISISDSISISGRSLDEERATAKSPIRTRKSGFVWNNIVTHLQYII